VGREFQTRRPAAIGIGGEINLSTKLTGESSHQGAANADAPGG
jgi:hypothetical protein